jgi:hypothetical protein
MYYIFENQEKLGIRQTSLSLFRELVDEWNNLLLPCPSSPHPTKFYYCRQQGLITKLILKLMAVMNV